MPDQEDELLLTGDDWAEDHHDVEVQDEAGRKLAAARVSEGVEGIAKLHELVARHGGGNLDAAEVVVGIETDRGSWVQALIASGYVRQGHVSDGGGDERPRSAGDAGV
ncbi:transposase [Actinomadura opuntiae]|uniref:transposase n=1 Tax=Actinomadura sp. OS1-43 TaxID=604315 RepID=UPI00255B3366|nr:transposase [Actinomadura sp. OS1-43]MDL4813112.1 transposase [Actinomadura sp. OS1-43]